MAVTDLIGSYTTANELRIGFSFLALEPAAQRRQYLAVLCTGICASLRCFLLPIRGPHESALIRRFYL
jgi:hypothetical protein